VPSHLLGDPMTSRRQVLHLARKRVLIYNQKSSSPLLRLNTFRRCFPGSTGHLVWFSSTHRSTRLAASDCKTAWSSRGIRIDNIYLDHPMDFPLGRLYVPANPGDKGRRAMAQVIQFYIPTSFQRKVKWVAPQQRGKVIRFQREVRKSA
jgi:hypothetical protein